MEGNQCKALLLRAGELAESVPAKLRSFALALQLFDKVRTSCFGKVLKPDYQQAIGSFEVKYRELDLTVIPKAHIVFSHVVEFCNKKGQGLGVYSEQASESVHHDFAVVWERFSRELGNPSFGDQLLKAVVKYNSVHL